MINIRKFIDKVASMEGRQGSTVVLPIIEARALRDEISKLIIDRYEEAPQPTKTDDVIQVELKGSKW
jgi:hypothetical protein